MKFKGDELFTILPHRPPMLLLDEAEGTPEGGAVSRYTVRGDEFFLKGHFPGNPVVPGVILCEMMAQTCAVCLSGMEGKTSYFTSLDKVRFRAPVRPGDTVEFSCEITRIRVPFYFAKGVGMLGERVCVEGEFSFALVGGDRDV